MDPPQQPETSQTAPSGQSLQSPPPPADPAEATSTTDPPATPTERSRLSHDERIRIRTLAFDAGWTMSQIAAHTGATLYQVRYTMRARNKPKKRVGRPPLLSDDQVQKIVDYVQSTADDGTDSSRLTYVKIQQALGLDCSSYAVRYALRRAGIKVSEVNKPPPPVQPSNATGKKRPQKAGKPASK